MLPPRAPGHGPRGNTLPFILAVLSRLLPKQFFFSLLLKHFLSKQANFQSVTINFFAALLYRSNSWHPTEHLRFYIFLISRVSTQQAYGNSSHAPTNHQHSKGTAQATTARKHWKGKKGKKRDVNTTEKEYTINMSSRAEGASKLNRSQEHWVTDGDQDHKQIQYLAT